MGTTAAGRTTNVRNQLLRSELAVSGGPKFEWSALAHCLLGGFIALIGAVVALGGGWLMLLGGSWSYGLASLVLVLSGVLTLMRRPGGSEAYLTYFLGTVAWALLEVGLETWLLMPRVFAPALLGLMAFVLGSGLARRCRALRSCPLTEAPASCAAAAD